MKYIHILAMLSALLEFAVAFSLPSWSIVYTIPPVMDIPKIWKIRAFE